MRVCLQFTLLLFLSSSKAQVCPASCRCSVLESSGFKVNCSSQGLTEVPLLPASTTELYLQKNLITTVPPGQFDKLTSLKKINFSGNPWHCSCDIRYLKAWLDDHAASPSSVEVLCFTPPALAHRPLLQLAEKDFSECTRRRCAGFVFNDVFLIILLGTLLILLLLTLKTARSSAFIFNIDQRHTGMEMETLKSQKPRHRKRPEASFKRLLSKDPESPLEESNLTEDSEILMPLLNMEILPQVLEVLQNKHNIKIKAT
ncbi:GPIX protein, partial [Atractosteus spatula]|nr:GPIX protein [Atractosteus spatula]